MADIQLNAIHAQNTQAAKQLYIAALGGKQQLPAIKEIGFSSGTNYVRPDLSIIQPNSTITALPDEFLRVPITDVNKIYPTANTLQIQITFDVNESNVSGQNLALFGLYDTAGNLIAFDNVGRLLLLSGNLKVTVNWLIKCP